MENKKPVILCIMDGYGIRHNPVGNAVYDAKTPKRSTTQDEVFGGRECAAGTHPRVYVVTNEIKKVVEGNYGIRK